MHSFSWRVVAADTGQGTIEVEYSHPDFGTSRRNVKAPSSPDELEELVRRLAPTGEWESAQGKPRPQSPFLGRSGTATVATTESARAEAKAARSEPIAKVMI